MTNFEQELALQEFLRGFKGPKNAESAKKSPKKDEKNVTHSVSTGECKWEGSNRAT
jgi:hypothetical protein